MSKEQEALRDELRAYYDELLTPEVEADIRAGEGVGAKSKEVWKKMAADGYAGVGWPKEWGGRGLTPIEQFVFFDESMRSGAPVPMLTINSVAPTIMRYGSEEQKQFYVPKILKGEIHFAIGYTEPEAGTDLASLRTRAVRDGDEYVVHGQKIFTTGGHDADYIWLACRTDPEAPRHKGISILIADTRDPGYSWTPIITHDGAHHVNVTYYDGVRVPAAMRVGAENGGWRLITEQLNHERVMLGPAGRLAALHDRVRDWAASHEGPDGRPLLWQPDVRRVLARSYASLRVNELLNWQVAVAERVGIADASATKVYSSEQIQRLGQEFEEIVARHGDPADPDTARLSRWLDVQAKRNTVLTFGGGVNEIQRELIASAGLGLPRVPR